MNKNLSTGWSCQLTVCAIPPTRTILNFKTWHISKRKQSKNERDEICSHTWLNIFSVERWDVIILITSDNSHISWTVHATTFLHRSMMTEMSAFQLSVTMGITMMTTMRVMRVACNNGQLFACQLEFESVFTELLRSYSVPDLNFMRQNLHQLSHKSITSALTRSVSRKRPSHSHYRIILNHVRLQTPKRKRMKFSR